MPAVDAGAAAVVAVAGAVAALGQTVAHELRSISARQLERRLQTRKHRLKRRLYGTTRPGILLKHLVPLKTDH